MENIRQNLYVGVPKDADDRAVLDARGIKSILFLSTMFDTPVHGGITCGIIKVAEDSRWTEKQLARARGFISDKIKLGGVLVVSDFGTARCYTAVNAYLEPEEVAPVTEAEPEASEVAVKVPEPPKENQIVLLGSPEAQLSVVVVTFNRVDQVKLCIASIIEHTDVPFELVVIDNQSTDATADFLESIPGLDVVRLPHNYGKSRAANLGFKRSNAPWVAYFDSDIEVPPGWFRILRHAYRNVADAGWLTLPYRDQVLTDVQYHNEAGLAETETVDGGMVFIHRAVLDDIGGFTEDKRYGHIDTEFMKRARKRGYKVGYLESEKRLVHLGKQMDTAAYRAYKERLKVEEPPVEEQPLVEEQPPVPEEPTFDGQPTVDIVLLRYNLIDYELRCIESIMRHTEWPHILTVIDNYKRKERIGVLWNECIENSSCAFVCLLNTDTVVTEDWLSLMMDTFRFEERIAVVGPSTNMAGGDQKITSREVLVEEAPHISKEIAKKRKGQWTNIGLSGFCYLIRKDVWKKVGGFSPQFKVYGQESELNHKIIRAGYWTVWREDAFVWHKGRASVEAAVKRGELDYQAETDYATITKNRLVAEADERHPNEEEQ